MISAPEHGELKPFQGNLRCSKLCRRKKSFQVTCAVQSCATKWLNGLAQCARCVSTVCTVGPVYELVMVYASLALALGCQPLRCWILKVQPYEAKHSGILTARTVVAPHLSCSLFSRRSSSLCRHVASRRPVRSLLRAELRFVLRSPPAPCLKTMLETQQLIRTRITSITASGPLHARFRALR